MVPCLLVMQLNTLLRAYVFCKSVGLLWAWADQCPQWSADSPHALDYTMFVLTMMGQLDRGDDIVLATTR